jgi:hypothetical protein
VTNRVLPIVAGAVLVGGTAALAWQATPVQRAALAVGEWCSTKEHNVLCGALAGVAANLVTMELGRGRILLAPVAKMCSANPGSCLWLGSIISFVVIDSNSKTDSSIIVSDDLIKNPPNPNIYRWEITKRTGICEMYPDSCKIYNNKNLLPLSLQESLTNSRNIGSDSQPTFPKPR